MQMSGVGTPRPAARPADAPWVLRGRDVSYSGAAAGMSVRWVGLSKNKAVVEDFPGIGRCATKA